MFRLCPYDVAPIQRAVLRSIIPVNCLIINRLIIQLLDIARVTSKYHPAIRVISRPARERLGLLFHARWYRLIQIVSDS